MNARRCLSAGLIVLLFAALPLVPGTGQPDRASAAKWVARYNGTGNGADRAWAMAVDKSGNVVVTGQSAATADWYSSSDFATVKYSPTGKRLWVQRYDGSQNRDDSARAIAVDAAGNVFVTGTTNLSDGDFILTVKYGPDGKRLWIRRHDDGVTDTNAGWAVAVDASGNAYVAGEVWDPGSATNCDAVIIKYNPSGKALWAKKVNGAANGWDSLNAIATDGAGNVYAAGKSWGAGTSFDYLAVKLNSNGKLLWAKKYNGTGNLDDRVNAMAVDAAGNVYVTGESQVAGMDFDYATLKYDAAGNQLWVQRYDGPGNDTDQAAALGVDGSGNVYVTGISDGAAGDADAATIKYGPDGDEVWVQRYNGPGKGADQAEALGLDAAGNIYITGSSLAADRYYFDYVTIKYDAGGAPVWVKRYNGSGRSDDYAEALALDKSGNVFVAGQSTGSGTSYDYVTIKY
jgi:uncharacterized delta-60 repeat protein